MEDGDKRRFARVVFDSSAELNVSGHRITGQVHDVSLKGALLITEDNFDNIQLEDSGNFEFTISGSEITINMEIKVAHLEPHRIGVECTSIDLDSASHLRRLVEMNLGDETLLQRELHALLISSKES